MRASPYVRIMEAAYRGKGVSISADEVYALALDCHIALVAEDESGKDYQSPACDQRRLEALIKRQNREQTENPDVA